MATNTIPIDALWQKKVTRALCRGMSVTTPGNLLPDGKFQYLQNVRVRQVGTIQQRDGLILLFSIGGDICHSMKRFLEELSGTDILIVIVGTNLYINTTGLVGGFSGFPVTWAVAHPSDASGAWAYIGDFTQVIKIGVGSLGLVPQDWGIPGPGGVVIPVDETNPAAFAARPGVTPIFTGDGRLTIGAPYRYRYLYRTEEGALSAPSLQSDPVEVDGSSTDSVQLTFTMDPNSASTGVQFVDFYRFGGSLSTWRRMPFGFLIFNDRDQVLEPIIDEFSDLELAASDIIPDDNFPPFQSVDASGDPVRVKLAFIWGPQNNVIFACGDPARPGDLYWTNPGFPDGHDPKNHVELCGPAERLVNGFLWDGRSWVFSNERLFTIFPNFAFPIDPLYFDGQETPCGRGLAAPWAFCLGDAIYFLTKDGVAKTNGGPHQNLTDEDLYPLFPHEGKDQEAVTIEPGLTVQPPSYSSPQNLRMEYHNGYVYLHYLGLFDGAPHHLVLDTKTGGWFYDVYDPGDVPAMMYSEEGHDGLFNVGLPQGGRPASLRLLVGSRQGNVLTVGDQTDDGVAIPCRVITPDEDGGDPRMPKLFGDESVEVDTANQDMSITPSFKDTDADGNEVMVTLPATVVNTPGIAHKLVDVNAGEGQLARSRRLDFEWESAASPALEQTLRSWTTSWRPKPDETAKRVIDYHHFLQTGEDAYVRGIKIWCDTEGLDKTIQVWRDGVNSGIVLTVNSTTTEKVLVFSWPSFKARLGRLLPIDINRWRVTRWEWIAEPEPTLEPDWDTNWDKPCGDAPVCYVTGVQVIADTENAVKTLRFQAELEGVVTNLVPYGFAGNPTIQHDGRLTVNFSFTPFRANQVRLFTLDQVPGRLYESRWHAHPEPPTLANWDATFIDFGKPTIIKGYELFMDSLGVTKTWRVELDGVLHKIQTGSHSPRQAKTYPTDLVSGEFPVATTARLLPTDNAKAYLYHVKWAAEEEPYSIRNWNTSWRDFGKDMLIKGVRIETNTRDAAAVAQDKTVIVQINQTDYVTLSVNHDGRLAKNYDLPVSGAFNEFPRGRTCRLLPTDEIPSPLYSVEWIADEEPYQLANWNCRWQNARPDGRAGFVQGFVITADTLGQDKSVLVEHEGGSFTVPVNQGGRQGVAYSFDQPFIAHQVRARPTDANAAWLYNVDWIAEPAPELGTVWEIQGTTIDWPGYHHERESLIALISSSEVQLTIKIDGTPYVYTIPSTGGLHQKIRVPFRAAKGKVVIWRFTSLAGFQFRIFKKDCTVLSKGWGDPGPYQVRYMFGGPHREDGALI